ncbi:MAG: DUF2017 domain-containing protein [Actinomycetota bacterium]|nr:DUF2017 domain-containing protein [Actinomycetota bacterium]
MGRFLGTPEGVRAVLDETEQILLTQLASELLELMGDDAEVPGDPLAELVDIGTATKAPDDPALARLFPDAYLDDSDAAAEFRRYTERSLRRTKRANATTALATLDGTRERTLTDEEARAWLGALNDMRLAIGSRLGLSDDDDEDLDELADDDPRTYAYAVYDHLTWLQETLVHALAGE